MGMIQSAGTYQAKAISATLTESKSGNPQVCIEFATGAGETIRYYGSFSGAAQARTFEALRATGWQGDDLADLSTVGSHPCEIVVADDEFNGRKSLKVKWVNAVGAGPKGAMSPSQVASFAARMKALAAASRGGKPAAAPARPVAPSDDGIPF